MKQNIEIERVKARMKKGQVAKAIGVTNSTYTNYVNELRPIPSDMLEALSDLFGVSCDYLLGREGKYDKAERRI